jgi:hypothetical protein
MAVALRAGPSGVPGDELAPLTPRVAVLLQTTLPADPRPSGQ